MADRLGPLHEDQGKVPVKERLGPVNEPRVTHRAGGRTHPRNNFKPSHKGKTPVSTRLGVRIQDQEPVEVPRSQKRGSKRVTLKNANKAASPQKETHSSDDDIIPEKSCKHTIDSSGHHADEAVLSACSCPKTTPKRVSVFQRLSSEASNTKLRHFRKKRSAIKGLLENARGLSSDDEASDANSAITSDNTVSNPG
uniref:Uncharacterized protein n=1 Tax=Asparagus officinalis TaxID=4686 RepID=Q2XNV8_ASPOF|nr:hypothetical protein 12.t00025 [Asparagus officinalis]